MLPRAIAQSAQGLARHDRRKLFQKDDAWLDGASTEPQGVQTGNGRDLFEEVKKKAGRRSSRRRPFTSVTAAGPNEL
jgi:hypothetical protein